MPEADGDDGGDVFSYALLCESLFAYGVDFSVAIAGGIFTALNLALHGSEDQKQRFLKPFMRGEDQRQTLAGGDHRQFAGLQTRQHLVAVTDEGSWLGRCAGP
ncbi:MAG: acyl-CoA dehydrogenase family protein [Burkholderiales bacterium]